jgi:hypothetical protein
MLAKHGSQADSWRGWYLDAFKMTDTGIGPAGIDKGATTKGQWIEDFIDGSRLLNNNIAGWKIAGIALFSAIISFSQDTGILMLTEISDLVMGQMTGNKKTALRGNGGTKHKHSACNQH